MSREFGEHQGGFMHQKVDGAADDCREGHSHYTRALGEVLSSLVPIAWACSSVEAFDSDAMAVPAAIEEHRDEIETKLDALIYLAEDVTRYADDAYAEVMAFPPVVDNGNGRYSVKHVGPPRMTRASRARYERVLLRHVAHETGKSVRRSGSSWCGDEHTDFFEDITASPGSLVGEIERLKRELASARAEIAGPLSTHGAQP